MLRIFEAELIGNLADGQTGLDEQLLGALDDGILDVALGGGTALLADQVAEVPAGAASPIRTVCCTHLRCLSG